MARKPVYNEERVARIIDAITRGETFKDAAKLGGISPDTFYEWQKVHPEFSDAVKKAKANYEDWQMNNLLADAKRGLATLIQGMEYDEIRTEYEPDPTDPANPRIKKQTRTRKKVAPNASAVIFALCNRDPEHWRNRVENEIKGHLETDGDINLSSIPDDLLGQVVDALRKGE